jgi:pyrimidine operon attenuation protein/uracil phosphoribosyltransferase
MIDEPDPVLTRLFAQQSQPEQESDFLARVIDLLERDRRKRRAYLMGTIIAGVLIAALLAPGMAQLAAMAIGSAAVGITATRSLLNFPMASLVVGSMVASFVPVIYLGMTRRW